MMAEEESIDTMAVAVDEKPVEVIAAGVKTIDAAIAAADESDSDCYYVRRHLYLANQIRIGSLDHS